MTAATNSYNFSAINAALTLIITKDTYKDHKELATVYFGIIRTAFEALDNGINKDESGTELSFSLLKEAVEQQKLAVLFLDVNFSDDKTGVRYFELRTLAMENVRKLKTYQKYLIVEEELDRLLEKQINHATLSLDCDFSSSLSRIEKFPTLSGDDEGFMKLYEEGIKALERMMLVWEHGSHHYYRSLVHRFDLLIDRFVTKNPSKIHLKSKEFIQKLVEGCRPVFDQRMCLLFSGFEKGDQFCKDELLSWSTAIINLKQGQVKIKGFKDKVVCLLFQPYIDKILSLNLKAE